MSNEIKYSQHNIHFSTPHHTIQQLLIEGIEQLGCTSYVIKFSHQPTPDSLVNWGLITSINPLKCYGYDWMFKAYLSEMMDILDDKIHYDACVDFVQRKSYNDLISLLDNAAHL